MFLGSWPAYLEMMSSTSSVCLIFPLFCRTDVYVNGFSAAASSQAKTAANDTVSRWNLGGESRRLAWNTYRAICRRGGVYQSTKAKHVSFHYALNCYLIGQIITDIIDRTGTMSCKIKRTYFTRRSVSYRSQNKPNDASYQLRLGKVSKRSVIVLWLLTYSQGHSPAVSQRHSLSSLRSAAIS
jgi:hypothetical protein